MIDFNIYFFLIDLPIELPIHHRLWAKGPGPDRLGFGLGGQGSWAGLGLAWGAKAPGPDRLGFGLGAKGP